MRSTRRNNKSRKTRKQRGGKHCVYYGKITNSTGKNKITNTNFMKGNNRGTNAYWQDINTLLYKHVRNTFKPEEIMKTGFGGNNTSGIVIVESTKNLPPMKFTIDNKEYTMNFIKSENNNF